MAPLHLYLDIGNSRIKWAFAFVDAHLGKWYRYGAYQHNINRLFSEQVVAYPIEKIWCANVAGGNIKRSLEQQVAHLSYRPKIQFVMVRESYLHLQNAYRYPQQLGVDRWLAALSASYHYPQKNLLVINMGTVTTVDLVDQQGVFLGGWIFPGLTTMSISLGKATAQLPTVNFLQNEHFEVEPSLKKEPLSSVELNDIPYTLAENFGRDTISAIYQGCLAAQIGAIKHCFNLSKTFIGQYPFCILTGGASQRIFQQLDFPVIQIDNLVLQGLQIYAKNSDDKVV